MLLLFLVGLNVSGSNILMNDNDDVNMKPIGNVSIGLYANYKMRWTSVDIKLHSIPQPFNANYTQLIINITNVNITQVFGALYVS